MNRKFILYGLVGLHGNLSLRMIVIQLCFELSIEGGGGHTAPFLAILSPILIILVFFILEYLKHLLYHLKVVIADSRNPLYHPLHIPMTTFLLKVFDFLPQILRYLSSRRGGMVCLWESVLL
jgi:hypothetical protein